MASTIALGLLLVSCSTADNQSTAGSTNKTTAHSNALRARMTVDQFVAAIRAEKTPADLMPDLGIPLIANMRVHYSLADGVASESIVGTNRAITVCRDKTKEEIVIQRPTGAYRLPRAAQP